MMPVSNVEMATQKGAKSAKEISRAERNWDIGFKAVELVGFWFLLFASNILRFLVWQSWEW